MNKKQIVVKGKRKTSIARGVVKGGKGEVTINKSPYENLSEFKRLIVEEPINIAKETIGDLKVDIDIKVEGGGQESQIEACRLVIAKALVEAAKDKSLKKGETLKKALLLYDRNLLVADTRRKEPYKPGDSKARRKRQKSYR